MAVVRRRSVLLGLPAALAGCAIGSVYRRPALLIPAHWRDTPAANATIWPAAEWWRGFRSPQLDGLIATARAHNPDIAAAVARIRQADAALRIAGAPLLPGVDATGKASWQRSTTASLHGGHITTESRLYSLAPSASYELDLWGRLRDTRQAAIASALASRYDAATVALGVVTSVASIWFQVLAQADRLARALAMAACRVSRRRPHRSSS